MLRFFVRFISELPEVKVISAVSAPIVHAICLRARSITRSAFTPNEVNTGLTHCHIVPAKKEAFI